MAVYRSRGNFSSTGIASSWSLPSPSGVQNSDFLVMSLITQEWIVGFSALIVRPTGWTDLITDGFNPGAPYGEQYVLDPTGGTPRLFVWFGYRVASSEPANYSISASGNSNGLQGDVYAIALAGSLFSSSLVHADAGGGGTPVTSVVVPSVSLDTTNRYIFAVVMGGLMSTAVNPNGYSAPGSMTRQAIDNTNGAPNDSNTAADETVAGSGGSSGTRTFSVISGNVTDYAAVMLSLPGAVATTTGILPLTGAG